MDSTAGAARRVAERRAALRVGGAAALGISTLALPRAAAHASDGIGPASLYTVGAAGPAGGFIFLTPDSLGGDGTYFYEAAPEDAAADGSNWASFTSGVAGARGTAVGAGITNTAAIMAGGDTRGAAHRADNYARAGVTDWFLPSIDELLALAAVPAIAATLVSNASYWSSTEVSGNTGSAEIISSSRARGTANKLGGHRTRPVRRFTA